MILHLIIGYIISGVIAFIVIILKYFFPDEQFKRNTKNKQRVYKDRRYLLIPLLFIALWPIIVALIIIQPIIDKRAETKSAVKEMKWFIYSSENRYLKSHGYAPGGASLSPNDTMWGLSNLFCQRSLLCGPILVKDKNGLTPLMWTLS